jgi:filamentous hemagglutinin
MAYTINLTDGTVFATITDGTYNQDSSVTLVGKNYAGYGEFLDENFIQMLENFSNTTAPVAPLIGQLWWDKTNSLLKVYNGTIFKTVSFSTASSTQPTSNVTGDLWYDTTNQQVKVWTGSAFIVVGPAYSSSQGTTGAIPETINDNTATPHYVTTLYSNSVRVAIFSSDADFTAAAPVSTLFPTVYKGVTFSNAAGTNMAGNLVSAGNLVVTTGGTTTAVFTTTGANITGYTTVSGNVTGGNILTAGQVSATGNVTGANFIGNVIPPAGGAVSTTGNITGGNILTSGLISATGTVTGSSFLGAVVSVTANVTGGNVLTGGLVSATANVTGGNVLTGGVVSATANITGGNILTAGLISATANITTAGYYFGNGSTLTGISAAASATKVENGTSNIQFTGSGGSATVNIGGTSNVVVIDTTTVYANVANVQSIAKGGTNAVGNIGSPTGYFQTSYISTLNATIGNITGNITGGNVLTGGLISATSTITSAANITGGNLITSGTTGILSVNSITHTGTNATGNIGSSSSYFNQVFATATTALYADVAERFAADEVLEAGTVVELGGSAEITRSITELSENVFGVISTRAAYLMNGGAGENDTHPPVAMTGRVPVKVTGVVHKGDRLVSAGAGIARAAQPGEATAFNVIGRSLVDKLTLESGTIEAIVTIKN